MNIYAFVCFLLICLHFSNTCLAAEIKELYKKKRTKQLETMLKNIRSEEDQTRPLTCEEKNCIEALLRVEFKSKL